jgi:putative PIN family toxin of toxin-antitoxin system
MTTKVVLDTNVVVSANLVGEGLPAAILDLAINREILMIVSSPVLEEYEEVLHRPRLKLDPARVAAVMALIRKNSLFVCPAITATAASDESDNRFLECASIPLPRPRNG